MQAHIARFALLFVFALPAARATALDVTIDSVTDLAGSTQPVDLEAGHWRAEVLPGSGWSFAFGSPGTWRTHWRVDFDDGSGPMTAPGGDPDNLDDALDAFEFTARRFTYFTLAQATTVGFHVADDVGSDNQGVVLLDLQHPACGDGLADPIAGEQCDDGNTAANDGCDAQCLWEPAAPGELRNGAFEVSESVGGVLPNAPGDWDGDASSVATAQNGIVPLDGSRMLCFERTTPDGIGDGAASDIHQIVDVSHIAAQIDAGGVSATIAAFFNRVAFDGETDDLFQLQILAFDGTPDGYDDFFPDLPASLDAAAGELNADADPETWEEVATTLELPVGTRYVAIVQSAIENVVDDEGGGGLDGHYADGLSLALTLPSLCPAAPAAGCLRAAKASLSIVEKKRGNEKLKAKLKGFDDATAQSDLGDPLTGTTRYDLCLYDGAGLLAAELSVDRAGQSCGPKQKPCYKEKGGKGWLYKDPVAEASGTKKLTLGSGPNGKGRTIWQAGNKEKKDQTAMPTGITTALTGATSATVQIAASDGVCFEATLGSVKKADGLQFKAKTP